MDSSSTSQRSGVEPCFFCGTLAKIDPSRPATLCGACRTQEDFLEFVLGKPADDEGLEEREPAEMASRGS
jgi:hypothetical protein